MINVGVKSGFFCQECGSKSPRWMGKCPECASWNTLVEEIHLPPPKFKSYKKQQQPLLLAEVELAKEERYPTGMPEFDRVLGGGVVPGSLILVGGDPGIGKSTLLLQAAGKLGTKDKVLYISGEESLAQVGMRAKRLHINADKLYLICETNIETILAHFEKTAPRVAVIDSIQTMFHPDISSAPGSVSQVRESTDKLVRYAKECGTTIFVIGHVTKEGTLAGPRVLEHMVDTVLYFEGDKQQSFRILRTVKNRFGSTNELGIFEMQDRGLVEITNPSALFMARHPLSSNPGSVVVPSIEGTRPLLVEIQALLCANSFGTPRRMTTGVDHNRVALIMAVLEKRVGLNMGGHDAYVNVVGGVRLLEPAVDLAVALALASSFRDLVLDHDLVVVGEVGLTGEVRLVNSMERRLLEAVNLGFKKALIPRVNTEKVQVAGLEIFMASTVAEAIEIVF
ncbi:MAG: DNA repair protein RadA [Desulfotomaculum sp.]|nr:DNA repair protein RadA [Desulfotomaculum sp.]MCL0081085.1 DNA repair protein RadA [Peptococcaceae bacterium]